MKIMGKVGTAWKNEYVVDEQEEVIEDLRHVVWLFWKFWPNMDVNQCLKKNENIEDENASRTKSSGKLVL